MSRWNVESLLLDLVNVLLNEDVVFFSALLLKSCHKKQENEKFV